jgi:hypothetical protein
VESMKILLHMLHGQYIVLKIEIQEDLYSVRLISILQIQKLEMIN